MYNISSREKLYWYDNQACLSDIKLKARVVATS